MDEHSHHAASGLTEEESRNRDVLRHIMESSGFEGYCNEWWHYVLADEPDPNTYFNFNFYDTLTPAKVGKISSAAYKHREKGDQAAEVNILIVVEILNLYKNSQKIGG